MGASINWSALYIIGVTISHEKSSRDVFSREECQNEIEEKLFFAVMDSEAMCRDGDIVGEPIYG